MKTYARVDTGIVMEIILPATDPDGNEVPIEDRFVPALVAQMVDITDVSPQPEQGWTYDGTIFCAVRATCSHSGADRSTQHGSAGVPDFTGIECYGPSPRVLATWRCYGR